MYKSTCNYRNLISNCTTLIKLFVINNKECIGTLSDA